MSRMIWLLLLVCLSPLAAHASDPGKAACEVWQRELSFAQSVQRHDGDAFAAHISADAVFDANTDKPTHGVALIRQRWAAFLAGKDIRIDWYPKQVVVSADGRLAYSSGPYLFEDATPNAKPHYTIGGFATVWRRGADGVWRVAFDGGDGGKPATDADAAAFRDARQDRCPAGGAAS